MRYFPPTIPAGLTFERAICLDRYRASEGWGLALALRGKSVIDVVATADGDQHRFRAAASTTAGWAAGRYTYSVRATNDGEVFEVETGTIDILPDIASQEAGFDGRSENRIALDNIEAVLRRRATQDQERYRINNRELYRTPIADLIRLRNFYRSEVQTEERLASGGSLFRAVRVIL